MDEKQFRAAVEAAVRTAFPTDTTAWDDAGIDVAVDEIVSAASEWASDEYQRGHTQGMDDERVVHFG